MKAKFVYESTSDYLKPKEELAEIYKFYKDVWNELSPMLGKDILFIYNDVRWTTGEKQIINNAFENGLSAKETAYKIFRKNESIGDFLKPKSSDEVESAFNNLHSPQHKFNIAVQKGFLDKVKELLTNPKYNILDVNPNYMTGLAINTAVENGNCEMADLLLSDRRVRDYAKKNLASLLMLQAVNSTNLIYKGDVRMIDILRKHGIDSNYTKQMQKNKK